MPHRPASTVVLMRDAAGGPEVFMVRRHDRSAFMGGAHVFPGGRVEETDAAGVSEALAHRVAAIRELFEEAHVQLALDALTPFARWRTPPIDVRQFDAWFFLARMLPGQQPEVDRSETTEGAWFRPADALARSRAGEIALPPPTWTTLRELEPFRLVDDAIAWATARVVVPREPQVLDQDGTRLLLLPGDPLSTERWHEPPPAETRFRLAGGRWLAERAGP